MPDTTSTYKGYTLQETGGNENTWGDKLNDEALSYIDQNVGGSISKSISGNTTLSASEARNFNIKITGSLAANANITWPTFYGQVHVRNSTTGGFAVVCKMASGNTVTVPYGAEATIFSDGTDFFNDEAARGKNIRKAITSAHTVDATDAGLVLALGGTAFYTVAFPAASGLAAGQITILVNEDSGRAKWITINGGTNFYLWPGQVATIRNQNNTWQVERPLRWKVPVAITTIYVNASSGSDTLGASDGLATGAGAFATFSNAVQMVSEHFDFQNRSETDLTIQNASSATVTDYVHWAPHGNVGMHGGNALTIDLNGGTFHATSGHACLEVYFGGVLRIRNGTVDAPAGAVGCFSATQGGIIYVADGVIYGSLVSGAAHAIASHGGRILHTNDYSISGGHASGYHWQVGDDGEITTVGAVTATLLASVSFSAFIYNALGTTDSAALTIDRGAGPYNITAQAYNIPLPGARFSQNTVQLLFGSIPGITAGSWNGWTTFTPTLSAGSGSFTTTTVSARYKQLGADVDVEYDITITDHGTAATSISITLPTSGGAVGAWTIGGKEVAVNNKALIGFVGNGGGGFGIHYADGTVPIADGLRLVLAGKYQGVPL